ncbi:antitoxin Xre-like helix-turn-helix domain-containing protein [Ancylobacter sp. FA202]|uniref:MbcA/ParS/Xre antitoxin family protein n=1 Tax=Ancylobacter sp. FA202 TaxID=1111106 RepID=UPI0003743ADC|nr:antitoxin Xre-like helix-turn-helix domain-containing protein [Ancylobacter sp. FA202]
MENMSVDARAGAGPSRIPVELEAFFAIAEKWRLTTDEQIKLLGSPGRSTFFKWKKDGGAVPPDTTERISQILGIWKSLAILFTNEARGCDWIRHSNDYFDGVSALDVMLTGGVVDLYKVRWYLDAQRGG